MAAFTSQSFRFLDLPKENRLMVYERLPTKTIHNHCQKRWICPMFKSVSDFQYTLVHTTVTSLSILSTCRQIHSEASVIMEAKAQDILSRSPRIIVST
ncbi:hypothetical protein K491DRAFT_607620, partial [Lophiostoma macrostomum CBS 122681]